MPADERGPPSASPPVIPRQFGDVVIALTVFDLDDQEVGLSAEFDIGSGYQTASLSKDTLIASADGTVNNVVWDADSSEDIGNTAYLDSVRMRFVLSDSERSTTVESEVFSYGNDVPVVVSADVIGGDIVGVSVLSVTVQDTSSDLVDLAPLTFRAGEGQADQVIPLTSANVLSGQVTALATSDAAGGVEHRFSWDSSELTVGSTLAALELVAVDCTFDPCVESLPFVLEPVRIFNNQRPQANAVEGLTDPVLSRTGIVPVYYEAVDTESDLVDARFEYLDSGTQWRPCVEYPDLRSEGTQDLIATPEGTPHLFLWNATGVSLEASSSTVLRVSLADGQPHQDPDWIARERVLERPAGTPASPGQLLSSPTSVPASGEVVAADFDGNGVAEFVVAPAYSGQRDLVAPDVAFERWAQTFLMPVELAAVVGPGPMKSADYNGDGLLDVLSNAGFAQLGFEIYVLANLASPVRLTFSAGDYLPAGTSPASLTFVFVDAQDFSGDGIPDFIGVTEDEIIALRAQTDSGGVWTQDFEFAAFQPLTVDSEGAFTSGDFDCDGQLDFVVANDSLDVDFYRGSGNGTAWSLGLASLTSTVREEHVFLSHDFSGDGCDDLASVSSVNDRIDVFVGGQDFGLTSQFVYQGSQVVTAGFGDITNDGIVDLVVLTKEDQGQAIVLPGAQSDILTAEFLRPTTFALNEEPVDSGVPRVPQIADVNGDGRNDLLYDSDVGSEMLLGLAPPTAAPQRYLHGISTQIPPTPSAETSNVYSHAVADFDLDGRLNIALFTGAAQEYRLMLYGDTGRGGYPTGFATPPELMELGGYLDRLIPADVNGDGFPDLIGLGDTGGSEARHITMFVGGLSGFSAVLDDSHETLAMTAEWGAGDLDGDDVPELFFVHRETDLILDVFRLNGTSSSWELTSYTLAFADAEAFAGRPIVTDAGADGTPDIILPLPVSLVSGSTGDAIAILATDGSGGVIVPADIPTETAAGRYCLRSCGGCRCVSNDGSRYVAAGDLNDDGLVDIVHGGSAGGVGILWADPDGGFTSGPDVGPNRPYSATFIADGTGDGWADVIVGDFGAGPANPLFSIMPAEVVDGRPSGTILAGITGSEMVSVPSESQLGLITAHDLDGNGLQDFSGSPPSPMESGFRRFFAQNLDVGSTWFASGSYWVGYSAPAGSDRFGAPRELPPIAMHRTDVDALGNSVDWLAELRSAFPDIPLTVHRRTHPHRVRGFRSIHRQAPPWSPTSAGERATPVYRHGTAPDLAAGRGLRVVIPALPAGNGAIEAELSTTRVFQRTLTFVRANAFPEDPDQSQPGAAGYLPKLQRADGTWYDVFYPEVTWTELTEAPGGDLTQGTGPRFVLDAGQVEPKLIVLTDADGLIVALGMP